MRRIVFFILLLAFVVSARDAVLADIAGSRGGPTTLIGRVQGQNGRDLASFDIGYYREEFRLASIRQKYKLVRMRVSNYAATPLKLSAEKDRLTLFLPDNTTVAGLFDLQAVDGAMWDSFDAATRQSLAYPSSVNAGPSLDSPRNGSPEVIYLFAFFPNDKVSNLPLRFEYWIDSLQQTISIGPPPQRGP